MTVANCVPADRVSFMIIA